MTTRYIILSLFYFILLSLFSSLNALNFSAKITKNYNLIYAYGTIHRGDYDKLKRLYSRLPKYKQSIIVFSSNGGELNEGIKIGKFLKRYRIGSAVRSGSTCASSCALAYLGGRDRYGRKLMILPYGSKLGYHRFYYKNRYKVSADVIQRDFYNLATYLAYVDAPKSIIDKMFKTDHKKIYWIKRKDRRALRIKRRYANLNFYYKYDKRSYSYNRPRFNITQTGYIRNYMRKVNRVISSNKSLTGNVALNDINYKEWLKRHFKFIYASNVKLISATELKAKTYYILKNGQKICSYNRYKLDMGSEGWQIVSKYHTPCSRKDRQLLSQISNYLP